MSNNITSAQIGERLGGIKITIDQIETLFNIAPVERIKRSAFYTEAQYQSLCRKLSKLALDAAEKFKDGPPPSPQPADDDDEL